VQLPLASRSRHGCRCAGVETSSADGVTHGLRNASWTPFAGAGVNQPAGSASVRQRYRFTAPRVAAALASHCQRCPAVAAGRFGPPHRMCLSRESPPHNGGESEAFDWLAPRGYKHGQRPGEWRGRPNLFRTHAEQLSMMLRRRESMRNAAAPVLHLGRRTAVICSQFARGAGLKRYQFIPLFFSMQDDSAY
jgi:hypothetical protein